MSGGGAVPAAAALRWRLPALLGRQLAQDERMREGRHGAGLDEEPAHCARADGVTADGKAQLARAVAARASTEAGRSRRARDAREAVGGLAAGNGRAMSRRRRTGGGRCARSPFRVSV